MKNKTKKIALSGLVGLAVLVNGCPQKSTNSRENPDITRADEVYQDGVPKVLYIGLSGPGEPVRPQKRFYDTDGDGETVEQYVELYQNVNMAIGSVYRVDKNLIRPGAEPGYLGSKGKIREMTEEEMKEIDSLFQSLIIRPN